MFLYIYMFKKKIYVFSDLIFVHLSPNISPFENQTLLFLKFANSVSLLMQNNANCSAAVNKADEVLVF